MSTITATTAFGLRVGDRLRVTYLTSTKDSHMRIGTTGTVSGFATELDNHRILVEGDLGEDFSLNPDIEGWQKI